jgi:hypothetical protein
MYLQKKQDTNYLLPSRVTQFTSRREAAGYMPLIKKNADKRELKCFFIV